MPYIKQSVRDYLQKNPFAASEPGELNYVITTVLLHSLDPACEHQTNDTKALIEEHIDAYLSKTGRRYGPYNEVLGVLTAIGQEFWRRRPADYPEVQILLMDIEDHLYADEIAAYEDRKIQENGDVF